MNIDKNDLQVEDEGLACSPFSYSRFVAILTSTGVWRRMSFRKFSPLDEGPQCVGVSDEKSRRRRLGMSVKKSLF